MARVPVVRIQPAGELMRSNELGPEPLITTGTVVAVAAGTLASAAVSGLIIGGLAALIVNTIKSP